MSRIMLAAAAMAASSPSAGAATAARPPVLERVTGGQRAMIAGFLEPFGLAVDEERVFIDAAGWPLAIGPSLFADAAGNPAKFGKRDVETLAAAGRVIARPTEIRLVWQPSPGGGGQQLVRRYIGQAGRFGVVAEIGAAGWRFTTPGDRSGAPVDDGALAWAAA